MISSFYFNKNIRIYDSNKMSKMGLESRQGTAGGWSPRRGIQYNFPQPIYMGKEDFSLSHF